MSKKSEVENLNTLTVPYAFLPFVIFLKIFHHEDRRNFQTDWAYFITSTKQIV